MGKVKANLSRGRVVAVLACLACAWSSLAFPATLQNSSVPAAATTATSATTAVATTPAAPATSKAEMGLDSQPGSAVEFLGKAADGGKGDGGKNDGTDGAVPAEKKSFFSSLRFAPVRVRVGGGVGYTFVRQAIGNTKPTITESLTANLDVYAITYIWKPWFATVEGIGRYTNNLNSTSRGDASPPNSTLFGSGSVKLFPYSRFPFEASLSQGESYTGYGLGPPDSQNTMLRLTQRYTPRERKESYVAVYMRNLSGGRGLARDREDDLSFDVSSSRFDKQQHSLQATTNRRVSSNQSILLSDRMVSRHNYQPDSTFTVNGMSNLSYIKALSTRGSATSSTNLQLTSFGSWQPKERPYSLSASVRGYGNLTGASGALTTKVRSVNGTLGGVYAVNQYVNLDATANASVVEQNGERTKTANLAGNQAARINYPLPSINFGDLRYTRGVSASVVNRTNTTGRHSTQSATVSPSHALSRYMGLMGGRLSLSLNQALGLSQASRSPGSATLTHQGRANWTGLLAKQISTVAAGLTDQHTLTGNKNFFQMINLQATLSGELDRNASWNGNFTMQTSRSGDALSASPFSSSSSIGLGYVNQRMFNINRLSYRSDIRTSSQELLPILVATPKKQGEISWTNNFSYKIGRLQLGLQADVTKVQNEINTMIMFTAFRTFGS